VDLAAMVMVLVVVVLVVIQEVVALEVTHMAMERQDLVVAVVAVLHE
jgi:hypothetical protein